MIPVEVFLLMIAGLVGLAVYYFLIGDRGVIPYSDMMAALLGIFGSIFLAMHTAAGNIGYYEVVVVEAASQIVEVPVVDGSLALVFLLSTFLFGFCLIYSMIGIFREKAYERSL